MEKRFVGFYNPSVILTYIGVCSAALSMYLSAEHIFRWSIFFLMISGLCDMFDGAIARKVKRSDLAKKFGIQIDSLCDLVCFGVTPAVLAVNLYCGGKLRIIGFFCGICIILAAVIRLAYFNVTEEERQATTTEKRKYYEGLPVTNSALICPFAYIVGALISRFANVNVLPYIFSAALVITAFFFLFKFKMAKVYGKGNVIIIIFALGLFAAVLLV